LNKKSNELKAVVGKEGELKRLNALISSKEEELKTIISEEDHFQVIH